PPGRTAQCPLAKMLEKIGLPAKPSLRGNTWVVDASHGQGCTSQFTFINRKHHCRRRGGLFCNSCTQPKMFLRGQGDSPVRICEHCENLEEAARFERHGHKTRAGRVTILIPSKSGDGSAYPEELRQQALDEKKYKILKGEGRPAEALRAFKREKELERLAV
ncbi:phosphoinositide-binding protein, partial [Prunus dulcis]